MKLSIFSQNIVKKGVLTLGTLTALACTASSAFGEASSMPTITDNYSWKFAIGAEAGTTGFGPVAVVTANKYLTASVGYTWFDYDYTYNGSDNDYKAKIKFSNIQALLNYHPFAGTFHISAGAFFSKNTVDVTAKLSKSKTYTIGGTEYTYTQVGDLYGDADIIDGAVPFVGIGWSKVPEREGWGFLFDIGVLFIDSPSVHLTANGEIASNEEFKSDLKKEEDDINDDLDSFKIYPVIQLGVIYRF
jgi:hypothetical protein